MAKRKKLQNGTHFKVQPIEGVSVSQWDMGPNTQAQRAGRITEPVSHMDEATGKMVNPNGVKRARKISLAEFFYSKGYITKAQRTAGEKLQTAWDNTQRRPPAIKEINVDSSPKPDANIALQIDRISAFSAIMTLVDRQDKQIIDCVVLQGCIPATLRQYRGPNYQKGLKHLSAALQRLSDKLP